MRPIVQHVLKKQELLIRHLSANDANRANPAITKIIRIIIINHTTIIASYASPFIIILLKALIKRITLG